MKPERKRPLWRPKQRKENNFITWFTPCIFIELLTIKVPTVKQKFNICDTKTLEDYFHSDMFRWHIRHHHQEERVHTETWDATGEVKSFVLCTHCQSHCTGIDVHRPRPALYTYWRKISQCVYSAGRAVRTSTSLQWLWQCVHSNKDFTSPVASQVSVWTPSPWWWWHICHRNMSEWKWSSKDFVSHLLHLCITAGAFLVNKRK
jgi:hypothetical protein